MIQEKLVDEISLSFLELFIIGKYVKIRFKNWGSQSYFLSCRDQKIKKFTKIEHTRLFLFTVLVSFFYRRFSRKNWFKQYVSDFEQDHLLNLIILGVYAE